MDIQPLIEKVNKKENINSLIAKEIYDLLNAQEKKSEVNLFTESQRNRLKQLIEKYPKEKQEAEKEIAWDNLTEAEKGEINFREFMNKKFPGHTLKPLKKEDMN